MMSYYEEINELIELNNVTIKILLDGIRTIQKVNGETAFIEGLYSLIFDCLKDNAEYNRLLQEEYDNLTAF